MLNGPVNEPGKFPFAGLIILEMANNHQGSVEHGKRIIQEFALVVRKAGVRAAMKFQLRNTDTFIHPQHRQSTKNKHIPRFLSTKLSPADTRELAEAARLAGFTTMATPSDEDSVDLLCDLDIEVIKIASASANDWPLLEKAVTADKPLVCSTGGLSLEKVDNLVSFLIHRGAHFSLMHCVGLYPTPNHKLNLERIRLFRERYPNVTIGFSTHEDPDNLDAVRVAYAMGARLFERHIGVETEEIKLNAYSSRPEQFARWLESYHQAISMSGTHYDFTKRQDPEEIESLRLQMRGVYLKSMLTKDSPIKRTDIFYAIPLQPDQMTSGQWREGLKADRDYEAGEPLPVSILPLGRTKREIIYKTIHDVKGMLNIARVPVNYDSNVMLHHHRGLEQFGSCGAFVIECFNRAYAKKIVIVLPGQTYPQHYHKRREETHQVLWGTLEVEVEGRKRTLIEGDTLLIPPGVWHAWSTPGGAIFEEISTGHDGDEDAFYAEQVYNLTDHEEHITRLINWGRHQFDDLEDTKRVYGDPSFMKISNGVKAVIFDMDGVIVDTEPLKFKAYQEVFKKEFGVEIEEDPARAGQHEPVVMKLYLDKYGLKGDIGNLIQKKRDEYYAILAGEQVRFIPGAQDFMKLLKSNRVKLGLATSSDRKSMDIILDRCRLRGYFDSVLSQEDIERKKPDPDMYLKSAELLEVEPKDCIVFEDSPAGVEAAKRAGMKCIAITTSVKKEDLAGADLVTDSLEDLNLEVLNRLA